LYFVNNKKDKNNLKNSLMDKILTKKIQTQLSDYFLHKISLTKPKTRCFKDMVLGLLKSKSVFVNQIAASLRESLKLRDVCKRLYSQYLKDDYADNIRKHYFSLAAYSAVTLKFHRLFHSSFSFILYFDFALHKR
jgi:hypothetical protein